jgi:hypothetical protein
MKKYKIQVCRTYYKYCTVEVEAKDSVDAQLKALDIAEDFGSTQYDPEEDQVIVCKEMKIGACL